MRQYHDLIKHILENGTKKTILSATLIAFFKKMSYILYGGLVIIQSTGSFQSIKSLRWCTLKLSKLELPIYEVS